MGNIAGQKLNMFLVCIRSWTHVKEWYVGIELSCLLPTYIILFFSYQAGHLQVFSRILPKM